MSAANDPPVRVTFFADHRALNKAERLLTLRELTQLIPKTEALAKPSLPWLKLARFGDKKTPKGSLRHDGNVEAISGIEGDYDGGVMSFEEAVDILRRSRLHAMIYTSPSHTPNKPRWRVLLPTSQELPPGDRQKLMARLNGLFGGVFARESFTLSQAYYYGHVKDMPPLRAELING